MMHAPSAAPSGLMKTTERFPSFNEKLDSARRRLDLENNTELFITDYLPSVLESFFPYVTPPLKCPMFVITDLS